MQPPNPQIAINAPTDSTHLTSAASKPTTQRLDRLTFPLVSGQIISHIAAELADFREVLTDPLQRYKISEIVADLLDAVENAQRALGGTLENRVWNLEGVMGVLSDRVNEVEKKVKGLDLKDEDGGALIVIRATGQDERLTRDDGERTRRMGSVVTTLSEGWFQSDGSQSEGMHSEDTETSRTMQGLESAFHILNEKVELIEEKLS
ncbi:hypothetical protein CI109_102155 [Kwoniella shandongensis]|uniref:Uncharacterized protein n=1 Tax=Kwoniella shandongensis TaxID=1734106 RepID=A0A5M6C065_9TREE|nr:uncharacterized protein CI109_003686 [Kwoniella shandongensis]KAA5528031.1 hypothetical protein CI109_003686 [Kwoniella shandongensis]